MTSAKMNAITQLTLSQIEKLEEIVKEKEALRRKFDQLQQDYTMLHAAVSSTRGALRFASEQGVIPPDEYQQVQNALIRLEALETGVALPPDHPALQSGPPKAKTLLEVVDAITAAIDGVFRAEDVRKQLEPHLKSFKKAPHRASITGTLNHLVTQRKLERVGGGGRGNEATYKRKPETGFRVNEDAAQKEETPMIPTQRP